MSISVLIKVIENCSEDVQKNKCQRPVPLGVTRQLVIIRQIPEHPRPKNQQRQDDNHWNQPVHLILLTTKYTTDSIQVKASIQKQEKPSHARGPNFER
jgi:hypothetical protein